MLIPPLITMQEVLEEMFGERAERMTTGSGEPFVFVTAKWHGFVLCMVDNSGQDAVFLRAQLFLIFRLLVRSLPLCLFVSLSKFSSGVGLWSQCDENETKSVFLAS
jgi:hypothetical protein